MKEKALVDGIKSSLRPRTDDELLKIWIANERGEWSMYRN
jgi:hypothetical protein